MWGKVVKEKFVVHLMPEILIPNLSGSKHFNPGFSPIEKWPRQDPPKFSLEKVPCYLSISLQIFCRYIRHSPTWFPTIRNFLIPGHPDPLWPAKLKNGHFWVFLDFWTIKKYTNLKIEDIQFEAQSTSFNLIPKLSGLDRAEPSYGQLTVPVSENLFSKQIYVIRFRNNKIKK